MSTNQPTQQKPQIPGKVYYTVRCLQMEADQYLREGQMEWYFYNIREINDELKPYFWHKVELTEEDLKKRNQNKHLILSSSLKHFFPNPNQWVLSSGFDGP